MEEITVPILRSRSRSKTPLSLNRDHEDNAGGEHVQSKQGRKTPVISSDTPTRLPTTHVEPISEETEPEVFTSPPAHRTRNALRQRMTPIPQTGAVTTEYSLDDDDEVSATHIAGYLSEEHAQNVKNYSYEYERITTSTSNNSRRRSLGRSQPSPFTRNQPSPFTRNQPSPSGSERSNESFADSILADSCRLSAEGIEHLPYKVYKNAGEYWNKYPKTDYTYSRLSKDRVELAPGQVAVPNMSRPSLHMARHSYSGDNNLYSASSTAASSLLNDASDLRQRWTSETRNSYGDHLRRYESISDSELEEVDGRHRTKASAMDERWWITWLVVTIWTKIVTTTTTIKSKILGRDPRQRYPYYVTKDYKSYNTRTEETSWYNTVGETVKKRRWWLLFLLLLLLPFTYWLYGGTLAGLYPYTSFIYSSNNKVLPIVVNKPFVTIDSPEMNIVAVDEKPGRGVFEITDDIINAIVLRVKQSLPAESPKPQIIERIVEKSDNNFDPMLLIHQQDLIDKLSAEINALKATNKHDDEEKISALISKYTTKTIVQILGLAAKDGSTLTNEDIKHGLLKESKSYVDEKLVGFQQLVSGDLDKIAEGVTLELKGIKKDMVCPSGGKQVMQVESGCQCVDQIKKIVNEALIVYDADKTGLVDYAMESAGGQVISTRCTESYQPHSAVYSLLGVPLWSPSYSPRTVITPGSLPGQCWAFKGFPGYLVFKLYKRINVSGFSMEHTPSLLIPHGEIDSAPKMFTVWGLQDVMDPEPVQFGSYEYLKNSTALQYFPANIAEAKPDAVSGHDLVEIRIESNHGNPVYTCLYRFRVHGEPIDELLFFGSGPER